MYKDGQTFCLMDYLSPCFIKLRVAQLNFVFFVLLCNYPSHMKTNGSCISNITNCNAHLNFGGMQVFFVWFYREKCCSDHPLV